MRIEKKDCKDGRLPLRFGKVDVNFNCSNCGLTTLEGAPKYVREDFKCNNNKLTSLPTLPNSLKYLLCGGNNFTTLSLTGYTNLKQLDISNSTSLTTLNCYNNGLTTLNVSGCSALNYLDCSNNTLSSLSVQGTNLSILHIEINNISGDNMTALINSMRTIPADNNPGAFYVFYEDLPREGNAITNEQILLAISKNWKLWKHQNQWVELTVSAVRGDLNGDGLVDVSDVSLLIDRVLGKDVTLAPGADPDLVSDGNIDVSDVSMLIDIVLGK